MANLAVCQLFDTKTMTYPERHLLSLQVISKLLSKQLHKNGSSRPYCMQNLRRVRLVAALYT